MNGVLDQLQRPLRDLRISVTDQCNFRCAYCMPKEVFGPDYAFLPKSETLTSDEIVFVALAFAKLGVRKIRLTGGEPLLRRDLCELVARLAGEVGIDDISLTTNGSLLPRYASQLKQAGLKRINISLDSLDTDRFAKMNGGRSTPEAVVRGIDAAEEAGLPIKINMVARLGVNEEDILPMVDYFRQRRMTLRFIEFMDVGESNRWRLDEVVPARKILDTIATIHRFHPIDPEYRGEVASRYQFDDMDVEFGIISSITKPFCGDCNRARISAAGRFYTCLFASSGVDLRSVVRSGIGHDAFIEFARGIWIGRRDRYSEMRAEQTSELTRPRKKIEMSYIGG